MENYTTNDLHLLMLHMGFERQEADWNWKDVRSPYARLYYVTEGEAQVVLPNGTFTLTPHHLYLIPPYTTHTNICTGTFSHYYVHIYEDPNFETNVFDEFEFPFEIDGLPEDEGLMRRLTQLNPQMRLPQQNPRAYDAPSTLFSNLQTSLIRSFPDRLESHGIICAFVARFLRAATPKEVAADSRIRKTLKYIRHHLNTPLELNRLCERVYLTRDHFIRLFSKQTGFTPKAYIIGKKMERAELLLLTTDMSVKEVAHSLGYDDLSYFTKLFKKHALQTPQRYRAQSRSLSN